MPETAPTCIFWGNLTPFSPASTDVLVAAVDFGAATVTPATGQQSTVRRGAWARVTLGRFRRSCVVERGRVSLLEITQRLSEALGDR